MPSAPDEMDLDEIDQRRFDRLCAMNPYLATAMQAVKAGVIAESAALKNTVVALAESNECLSKAMIDLMAIAPKRYRLPNNETIRWDAPDNMVPLTDIPIPKQSGN